MWQETPIYLHFVILQLCCCFLSYHAHINCFWRSRAIQWNEDSRVKLRSVMTLFGSLKSLLRNSCVNQYANYAKKHTVWAMTAATIWPIQAGVREAKKKNRQQQFTHFPLFSLSHSRSIPPFFFPYVWTFSFVQCKKKRLELLAWSEPTTKKRRRRLSANIIQNWICLLVNFPQSLAAVSRELNSLCRV